MLLNNTTAVWIDTLAFDGTDLWFVANALPSFFKNNMNFTDEEANMNIWRVRVGEAGYLQDARSRTIVNAKSLIMPSIVLVIVLCLLSAGSNVTL